MSKQERTIDNAISIRDHVLNRFLEITSSPYSRKPQTGFPLANYYDSDYKVDLFEAFEELTNAQISESKTELLKCSLEILRIYAILVRNSCVNEGPKLQAAFEREVDTNEKKAEEISILKSQIQKLKDEHLKEIAVLKVGHEDKINDMQKTIDELFEQIGSWRGKFELYF